MEQKKK
jgi:hypothetical protein